MPTSCHNSTKVKEAQPLTPGSKRPFPLLIGLGLPPPAKPFGPWMLASLLPSVRLPFPYWIMAMIWSLLAILQLIHLLSHLLMLSWLTCPPPLPIWQNSPLMRRSLPRHLLPSGRGLVACVALAVAPLSLPPLTTGWRVMTSL